MAVCRVLIVGGTGFIGSKMVKASLQQGHETYVLHRAENNFDLEKIQMLLSYKQQGAKLVEASFEDQQSLVNAVKLVDVVISSISGVPHRSHHILMQLQLVEAIKEAGGCIKRFLPSEFGLDPARMGHAISPGSKTFEDKIVVRKAIEDAKIPFTYISSNCFAAYNAGNLAQMGTLIPPRDKVYIYGDGNVKVAFLDEDDIAKYTLKTIDDPRTLNKTVYLRPPENVLTQNDLVGIWERLTERKLEKISISEEDFLASLEGMDYGQKVGGGHFYHIYYEGDTANFEIKDGEEASKLYPEIQYVRVDEYMRRYI